MLLYDLVLRGGFKWYKLIKITWRVIFKGLIESLEFTKPAPVWKRLKT